MEVVDELMTPGCPQCAVKHLSAALAYLVAEPGTGQLADPNPHEVYAARAYINLVEAMCGYKSHLDFAVGLLVLAEENASAYGDVESALAYRTVRMAFIPGRRPTDDAVVGLLRDRIGYPAYMVPAHLLEAMRELGSVHVDLTMVKCESYVTEIRREIAKVRAEYFSDETDSADAGRGGE